MTSILDDVDAFLKEKTAEPETGTQESEAAEVLVPLQTYRARFPNGSWLITYLKLLQAGGAEEATFLWNENEIHTAVMDPAHICMVQFSVHREVFEEYEAGSEKSFSFSIVELLKLLGRKKRKGWLELLWCPERNKLTVREGGEEWNSDMQSETTISLYDIEIERPPKPKLTFDTSADFEPKQMTEALTDLGTISDYVTISFDDECGAKMILTSKGELGKKEHRIPVFAFNGSTSTRATFSLSYLTRFVKALKTQKIENAKIALSTKKPLKISLVLPAAEMVWLVAPSVDTEESQ